MDQVLRTTPSRTDGTSAPAARRPLLGPVAERSRPDRPTPTTALGALLAWFASDPSAELARRRYRERREAQHLDLLQRSGLPRSR